MKIRVELPRELVSRREGDFTIQKRAGREVVARSYNGRCVPGASLEFVRWMHGHVPRHQLNTDQAHLVEWYDKYQDSDQANETVLIG